MARWVEASLKISKVIREGLSLAVSAGLVDTVQDFHNSKAVITAEEAERSLIEKLIVALSSKRRMKEKIYDYFIVSMGDLEHDLQVRLQSLDPVARESVPEIPAERIELLEQRRIGLYIRRNLDEARRRVDRSEIRPRTRSIGARRGV